MQDELDDEALSGIASLGDPRRRALYRYVVDRGGSVGRDEAAAAVGMGRALAAYHLDRLADDGLLSVRYERVGDKRGPGAGRPAKLYERSERQFHVQLPPRDYELAARIFADALDNTTTKDPRGAVLKAAHRLGTEATRSTTSTSRATTPSAPRHVSLFDVLRELGYEPIEVDGSIRLRNCPFHALTAKHRDLVCKMNLALVEGVANSTDGDLQPILDPRPGECCVAILHHSS